MRLYYVLLLFVSTLFFSCGEKRNLEGRWLMTETTCTDFQDIEYFEFSDIEVFIHSPTLDYAFFYTWKRDVVFLNTQPVYDITKLTETELILYSFDLDCMYFFEREM